MEPTFDIAVDRARSLLRITLAGFFCPADVVRFAEVKRAAQARLLCGPNRHVTLVDVTACKIQPQCVVGAFAELIADPRYRARRVAFVTGGSLAAMQVRRMIGGVQSVQQFADRACAEAWLLNEAACAA